MNHNKSRREAKASSKHQQLQQGQLQQQQQSSFNPTREALSCHWRTTTAIAMNISNLGNPLKSSSSYEEAELSNSENDSLTLEPLAKILHSKQYLASSSSPPSPNQAPRRALCSWASGTLVGTKAVNKRAHPEEGFTAVASNDSSNFLRLALSRGPGASLSRSFEELASKVTPVNVSVVLNDKEILLVSFTCQMSCEFLHLVRATMCVPLWTIKVLPLVGNSHGISHIPHNRTFLFCPLAMSTPDPSCYRF